MDIVTSAWSWCWHYPFEVYADKLLKSLKIGGTLMLTMQNPPDLRDVPKKISELLGSEPIYYERHHISTACNDDLDNTGKPIHRYADSNNEYGGFYVWIRKN